MVVFIALIVPLPFTVKRKLFTFLAESPIIAKLQYGLKVTETPTNEYIQLVASS
jgi:B-cell receptor-associated protein 31